MLPRFARRPSTMALMLVTGSAGLCRSGFGEELCDERIEGGGACGVACCRPANDVWRIDGAVRQRRVQHYVDAIGVVDVDSK